MRVYQRKEKIVQREMGGETLLIPINQTGVDLQKVYVLNETALSVWQKIQSPQTVKNLIASLWDEFEGDKARIESDVMELLKDLEELGLIEKQIKG